jgi:hypothetical protein
VSIFSSDGKTGEDRRKNMRETEIRRVKKVSRRIDTFTAIVAFCSSIIAYNEVKGVSFDFKIIV